MKAQDLKNSILQLAIQGKLVAQDEHDEPAEVLYAKIQAEKQKLIKDGKIKKDKPLPPISEDEIPFPIPPTWKWVRLGEIGSWGAGATPNRSNHKYYNGKIPWLKTGDLNDGLVVDIPETISQLAVDETSAKIKPIDSVLIAMYGATIGKLGILGVEAATNQACCACIPIEGIYNKYLFYYLLALRKYFIQQGAGGAQPNISREKIVPTIFPLPPLEEQKRIVAKIEELEPLINQYDQAEQELSTLNDKFPEQLKKSILQLAIQGKLVPQDENDEPAEVLYAKIQAEKQKLIKEGKIKKDKPLPPITEDEIPFPIPPTWKWVRWGELSESIQYGYNAPAKKNGRIKMLRISDIQQNNVVWDTVPYCDIEEKDIETYLLKANDLLFARTGGTVGKSFLVEKVDEDIIYAGYLIRTRYSRLLCPQYLKYFMESDLYWGQLRNGTIATAQPNCNGQTLSKMLLPLPPLEEQHRIVAKVEELLQQCNKMNQLSV